MTKLRLNIIKQVQIYRKYHLLSPIYNKVMDSAGFPPFLTSSALQNIKADQVHCLDRINALVKGTNFEGLPVSQLIKVTYCDTSQAHLYNYACQAFNNDFFLQSLNVLQITPPAPLMKHIQNSFGTFDEFISEFSMNAEFMFGNGWTWLIQNEEGQLEIVNTFNSSSPVYHLSIQKRDPLSIPSLLGQKIWPRLPLLCLKMWEHAFVPQYGMAARKEYVRNFWKVVDWQAIADRLHDNAIYATQPVAVSYSRA